VFALRRGVGELTNAASAIMSRPMLAELRPRALAVLFPRFAVAVMTVSVLEHMAVCGPLMSEVSIGAVRTVRIGLALGAHVAHRTATEVSVDAAHAAASAATATVGERDR